MFAVVQIGSKARRSPCITARSVFAGVGVPCALRMPGAPASAAAAAVVCRKLRRVLIMVLPRIGAVKGLSPIEAREGRARQGGDPAPCHPRPEAASAAGGEGDPGTLVRAARIPLPLAGRGRGGG